VVCPVAPVTVDALYPSTRMLEAPTMSPRRLCRPPRQGPPATVRWGARRWRSSGVNCPLNALEPGVVSGPRERKPQPKDPSFEPA